VEGATGVRAQPSPSYGHEFTRLVLEVPVKPEYPLPPLPEPYAGAVGHSMKHPSGLTELAKKLQKLNPDMLIAIDEGVADGLPDGLPTIPDTMVEDIKSIDFDTVQTPEFLYMGATAAKLFGDAAARAHRLSTNEIEVISGYSIKTNPDKRLIKLALDNGFYAEAISLMEVQAALDVGFRPDQVIMNGPAKFWRPELMPKERMHAFFCDSIADLERTVAACEAGDLSSKHIGVRIRTPNVVSRFGIPLDSPATFRKLIDGVKRLPKDSAFGIHFHMASSNIGVAGWNHLFDSMIGWCQSIEQLSGRTIEILDLGGGWWPDDWHDDSNDRFAKAVARVREALPHVRQIVSEPGKAMAQPSMALAMRILEIQEHEDDIGRGRRRRLDRRAAHALLPAAPDAAPVRRDRRAAAGRARQDPPDGPFVHGARYRRDQRRASGRDARRRPSDLLRCRRLRQEHVLCIWARLNRRRGTRPLLSRTASTSPSTKCRPRRSPARAGSTSRSATCRITARPAARSRASGSSRWTSRSWTAATAPAAPLASPEIRMGPLALADPLVRAGRAQGDRLRRPQRARARGFHRPRRHRLPRPVRPALHRRCAGAVAHQMGRRAGLRPLDRR
jgi:diaminopimelate decarboxylase